jgi:hypothetical protein
LVPDTFHILTGEVPDGFVHDEASLIRSSEECLADLPSLVDKDARAWTGSIGEKRTRHVRLMTTRLKPAVRATLVGGRRGPSDCVAAALAAARREVARPRSGAGARARRTPRSAHGAPTR